MSPVETEKRPAPSNIAPPPFARRQIMLDQPVQGQLLTRVTCYWLICLLSTAVGSWVWLRFSRAPDSSLAAILWACLPGWLGSLLWLPLIWADTLRVSSRFVVPVANLRNALKRLECGDRVQRVQSRSGDHWSDLIDRFNRHLEKLNE